MRQILIGIILLFFTSSISAQSIKSQATIACKDFLANKFNNPKRSENWKTEKSIVADFQVQGNFISLGKNRAFKCFVEGSYITRVVVWGSGKDWTDEPIFQLKKK